MISGARGLDDLREEFQKPLLLLFSLVGLMLLMACANVASLLLARAAGRQREISLRLALGAGRWRIMRQLLTEGLSLAILGGTAGILLGYWLRDSVPALLATSWRPSPFRAAFDTRVLFMSIATTLATGILCSLAPAWRSACTAINTTLKDTGRIVVAGGRRRRGKPLVVVQVSVSVLLLIGAGLFVRTLSNLRSETLGFRPERILLFALDPASGRSAEQRKAMFEQLEEQIAEIPGVEAVSLSADPLVGQGSSMTKVGAGNDQPGAMSAWKGTVSDDERAALQGLAWVNDVGYRFFETMGIPILHGRSFGPLDREGSPKVAIVSQQFARQFFPNENPIGKTFLNGERLLHVIGVAGDTRFDRVRTPFPPTFYRAYRQEPAGNLGPMTFEVRTAASDGTVVSAIRDTVRSIDKDLPVFDVRTQVEQIDATLSQERVFVALSTTFGLVALVLACIGIYGVMANGVLRRTNEIGIRIALGATRRDVVVMILRETLSVAGIGIVIGVLTAAGLTGSIRAMLYGVQPLDPLTIGGAIAMMLGIALLAGGIPARRASRLEPMAALRHE
jgi:predicted permease